MTHGADGGIYHSIHIRQFTQQYAMTGDSVLAQLGDLYYTDYPPQGVTGTIHFESGKHTGYRFTSEGAITAAKTISLARGSSAPSSDRGKVMRQTGIWYAISAGSLSGYRIREATPQRYQVGRCAELEYKLHRPGVVAVAAPKAYRITSTGKMSSVVTNYKVGDPVKIDTRAVLNGVEHVRLAEGNYAGRWVGASAITRK